ncbi:MAG: hypothetical protein [Microvirus sp.]|nr:MAG: hypothetical protein [Microvirus sp.]
MNFETFMTQLAKINRERQMIKQAQINDNLKAKMLAQLLAKTKELEDQLNVLETPPASKKA